MGLFHRRVELATVNVDSDWASSTAWLDWGPPRNLVAGESHYQPALRKLSGKPRKRGYAVPVAVTLTREPGNQYDRNAVRAEINGVLVGYVRRGAAAQLAPAIDRARCSTFCVCGVVRGGSPRAPTLGVHVWLDRRLTPGPEITFADDDRAVAWPPYDAEGLYCSADEEA